MPVVLLLLACARTNSPQPMPAPTESPAPVEEAPPAPLAGGWSDTALDAPELAVVREKMQALLREKTGDSSLTIREVTRARSQVVAGRNHELVMDLTTETRDRPGVTAVAYQDLSDVWTLTSVEGL